MQEEKVLDWVFFSIEGNMLAAKGFEWIYMGVVDGFLNSIRSSVVANATRIFICGFINVWSEIAINVPEEQRQYCTSRRCLRVVASSEEQSL